jgi:hypothetical protein
MKQNLQPSFDDENEDYGRYTDLIAIAEEELETETRRNQRLKTMKNFNEFDVPRLDNKRNKGYKPFKKRYKNVNNSM